MDNEAFFKWFLFIFLGYRYDDFTVRVIRLNNHADAANSSS